MNTTDLIDQVRVSAFIDDVHPVYTTARILKELWNQQNVLFSPIMAKARQGYGLRWKLVQSVPGQPFVRIPSRAIVNSLERVDLSADGRTFGKLIEATPREWPAFEINTGMPSRYMKRGDKLFLGPIPNGAFTVRLWFYLRPSVLHVAQTEGLITGTAGIGAPDPVLTVNALPLKWPAVGLGIGVPIVNGDIVDIVTSDGLFDVLVSDAVAALIVGTNVQLDGEPLDIEQVQDGTGFYLRASQQTDWPALPVDFHGTLADAAAVIVLLGLGKREKAGALAEKVKGDLVRFQELLTPRVKEDTYAARPLMQVLRRGRSGGLPWSAP